jgi:hypothetical protein
MKVEVDARYYGYAHGRAPRGIGSWAFGSKPNTPCDEVFWAPSSVTYSEAKVHAAVWARSAGLSVVYVQS